MFIDKARIFVKAGNGGNGAVSFRREKYVPAGGPDGGDGGRGASVIFEVDNDLRTLMDFKYQRKYVATPGGDGSKKRQAGKNGEDLVLKVPAGTIIRDEASGKIIADLKHEGDRAVVARGGRGGKGNQHFANAVRQAPNFAKSGTDGEERWVILELKMIADVGLLGFPNVGKSTFLSVVTAAKPKIANYHFTTLTPNLGVVQTKFGDSFVLADIPGLIEGAAEGIGLGHDFLRHVERTKVLIHIVDISGLEGRNALEDFDAINGELKLYNEKLSTRPQVVVANKIDILEDESVYEEFKTTLEERGYKVFKMSAATREGIDDVIAYVSQILKDAEEIELVSEEELYVPELDDAEEEGLQVEIEDGVYVVTGKSLRRIMYSVNFEDMESIQFFQKTMESQGVFDKLREMGIEDGDTVKIYDIEFEFYN
ncbi:MAG: GTPase ObgE [Clostridiales bacterium]|uniref:GTPase ObgE n=1 Tax=Terrisporobacter sp. TaxID=1965305 RepID=UPI002A538861|nr:GTPase ObgE [Terrisporobacter sp.]MCI6459741.1 GTPase ObgE [Clostridium sp.]MCI7204958.1 GTPase ObgE [Clostridium sp.]MDD7757323.1 GTPase ObgE [Clostridiales bacterium]MDY4137392.1 GTPase ObgE [Terrisporobacter sp.]